MNQANRVINHLKNQGRLDPITALKKYKCFRLAARICDLRNQGYNIKTHNVKHKDKTFGVYELID